MEPTVLTAKVIWQDGRYRATLDALGLEGGGTTVEAAQNELINLMRNWIEVQDSRSLLEEALAQAGFPGVEEDTELQLEFVEEQPELAV